MCVALRQVIRRQCRLSRILGSLRAGARCTRCYSMRVAPNPQSSSQVRFKPSELTYKSVPAQTPKKHADLLHSFRELGAAPGRISDPGVLRNNRNDTRMLGFCVARHALSADVCNSYHKPRLYALLDTTLGSRARDCGTLPPALHVGADWMLATVYRDEFCVTVQPKNQICLFLLPDSSIEPFPLVRKLVPFRQNKGSNTHFARQPACFTQFYCAVHPYPVLANVLLGLILPHFGQ